MTIGAGGLQPSRVTSQPLVLAVDQGTSATKAIVVDGKGTVTARSSVSITQCFPRAGWAEQDAEELWASVRGAVARCLEDVDPARVTTLALSTQRESMMVWERANGRPLGPIAGWQDTRGAGVCSRLERAGHAGKVRATTGLPLDAMFSAAKASALLDVHDSDRSRSRSGQLCVGTVDSWLMWKLTGRHLVEVGNAARTQLLDIAALCWDPWLLEIFDVPAQTLPEVTSSVGPFPPTHNLHPDLDGLTLGAVLGDSHAALFAHAGWRPGRVKVTYGTGSSVMGVAPLEQLALGGIAQTIAWQSGQPTYALEGNIRSSGSTLVWLARLLGVETITELTATAAADSDGVVLVPAFTGLGAPWWDERAKALITGLSDSTGPEHIARAAMESIAFQVEDVVAAVEAAAGPIGAVLADGGPSANATLMQLQADICGRPVEVAVVGELSALGAAQLAGLGAGLWDLADLEARADAHTPYSPNQPTAWRRERQDSWHAAVAAARAIPRRTS